MTELYQRVYGDSLDSTSREEWGVELEIKCHKCGQELPFLHPHIMLEKEDDEGNMICEECFGQL